VGCHPMNETASAINRAPIGFIVEGDAEYHCYPSLVCRIVNSSGFRVPRVNARGYGNIVRHLADQLKPLVLAHHPYHVIITLDLKDVLDAGLYDSCEEVRKALEDQVTEWLANSASHARLQPLPQRIAVVLQVQRFESWMIADIGGLRDSGYLAVDEVQPLDADEEVSHPISWLRTRTSPGRYQKNPRCAKEVISCLDPCIMRVNSRSFDKFHREVCWSYGRWCQECDLS